MRKPHLRRVGDAFVADDATVVCDVTLSAGVSIWYGVVVRGDVASITIGEDTNVQDLTVVHPQHDEDVIIGRENVIGHGALVHGRTIGDRCLIGMGSILLPGSHIGDDSLIAAGALIPPGMVIPERSVVVGNPGRIVRQVTEAEMEEFAATVERYRQLARRHLAEPTEA